MIAIERCLLAHASGRQRVSSPVERFRIVLVLMKANTRLSEHQANARISFHTVLGRIRVHLRNDGKMVELPAAGLLALDFSIPYDIESLEESAFLLTISWPKDYVTWAEENG